MKNRIFFLLLLTISVSVLKAQVPQSIQYQAVVRNASGVILPNQNVGIRFSIHDLTANGIVVYKEDHSVKTNSFGLLQVGIGSGKAVSGLFKDIPWTKGNKFLEIEMDVNGGSNYTKLDTTQLLSVPYAFFSGGNWELTGNSGTIDTIHYIGTNDNTPFTVRVNKQRAGHLDPKQFNAFWGCQAGFRNTTGTHSAVVGGQSLFSNTVGVANTSIGSYAMYYNVAGSYGTAVGQRAMYYTSNSTTPFTNYSVAVGFEALRGSVLPANNYGNYNTAIGYQSLKSLNSGYSNVAAGYLSLTNNAEGFINAAYGAFSMEKNTSGYRNTGIGYKSMEENTVGYDNTATGEGSLSQNISGYRNAGFGSGALVTNTSGNNNTALGYLANVSSASLSNATALGNAASVNASNKVRIGNTLTTVVEGQVAYTYPSDGRFKFNVSSEGIKGLEFIRLLRPVQYNFDTKKFEEFLTRNMADSIRKLYFENTDFTASTNIRQTGFIAQEIEDAMQKTGFEFNGLHLPQTSEDNYSVAYSLFVVPLVKAVQELDAKVAEQHELIQHQNQIIAELKKNVDLLMLSSTHQ